MRIPSAGINLYLLTTLLLLSSLSCLAQKPKLIIPIGHTDQVKNLASTQDGKYIFSAGRGRTIQWNTKNGQIINSWSRSINTFSKYGKYFYFLPNSLNQDPRHTELYERETGRLLKFPSACPDSRDVAISPDEKYIAIGSHNCAITLWDIQSGQLVQRIDSLITHEISGVEFSPDGRYLQVLYKPLSNSDLAPKLQIWDLQNRNKIFEMEAEKNTLITVNISPDRTQILTKTYENTGELSHLGFQNGKAILIEIPSGRSLHTFDHIKVDCFTKGQVSAFSPDGKILAILNQNGGVNLFDVSSRSLLQTFSLKKNAVKALSFLPNGKQLLTGFEKGNVILWDTESGEISNSFSGTMSVNAVDFSPDGHYLLTGNGDFRSGQFVNWDLEIGMPARSYPVTKHTIHSARFSADGKRILGGGNSNASGAAWGAEVLDVYSGQLLFSNTTMRPTSMGLGFSPAFSSDGRILLAPNNSGDVLLWDVLTQQVSDTLLSKAAILAGDLSPDGKYFVVCKVNRDMANPKEPTLSTLLFNTRTDDLLHERQSPIQEIPRFFRFSPEGDYFLSVTTELDISGMNVIGERHDLFLTETMQKVRSFETPGEVCHVSVISPNGQYVIAGLNPGNVLLWDAQTGECLDTLTGHSGPVRDLAFSHDGKYIASSSTDGKTKIWDIRKREELISLISLDPINWVVTTPSGLFDASPEAMRMMHYEVEYQGKKELIELEQLKVRYYEPGLLSKVLGFSDEAIRPVDGFDTVELFPEVTAKIDPKTNRLKVQLLERNGGIGKVSVFINNKEVLEEANPPSRGENPRRQKEISIDLSTFHKYCFQHPDSVNWVTIRAENAEGWLKSNALTLPYTSLDSHNQTAPDQNSKPQTNRTRHPKMYVLSIGTSNYSGEQLDLKYGDQDAMMMAKAMQSIGAALFQNGDSIEVHCFTTDPSIPTDLQGSPIPWQFASKTNIQTTFTSIKEQAKAEDIIMVYLSGHGVSKSGKEEVQFYYLTQGVSSEDDLNDPATRNAFTISSREMTKWINDIPALKQVLVIDACNSGQVIENLMSGSKRLNSSQIRALDRMKDRTGMFILAGSASDKLSYEASEYGQGLLTYAILQGMLGVATRKDDQGKDIVDVMKLFQYARDQVPQLAVNIKGIQTPMLGFPGQGASFDIGILDEAAKANIPIGNKKPVIIRSKFINTETVNDDLQLTQKLDEKFRKMASKGARANLVYVDVNAYPGAYQLNGLYETSDDKVTIKLRLSKGDAPPIIIQIESTTTDIDKLVDSIIGEVEFKIY